MMRGSEKLYQRNLLTGGAGAPSPPPGVGVAAEPPCPLGAAWRVIIARERRREAPEDAERQAEYREAVASWRGATPADA